MILLKNDEVIDFFNMTAYQFFSIKKFKLKMLSNFKNRLPGYC